MQKTQILSSFWQSCKRQIDTFCDKQKFLWKNLLDIIIKFFLKFELKVHLIRWHRYIPTKNLSRLLYYLNNKYGNFCSIWSNEKSISTQDNALSECYHLVYIFLITKAIFVRFDQTKRQSLHKIIHFQNFITYFIFFNYYANFCSIWSNENSISSQDNALSECYHLVHIFLITKAIFVRFDQTKSLSLHKIMHFQNIITYFIFFN